MFWLIFSNIERLIKWIEVDNLDVNVNQSHELLRSPGHGEADHPRHHGPGVHPDPELQCVARPVRDAEVLDGGEQLDGEGGDVAGVGGGPLGQPRHHHVGVTNGLHFVHVETLG